MCHGCVDHELYLCCVVLVLYLCCPSQWSVFLHVEDLSASCWTCWLWVLVMMCFGCTCTRGVVVSVGVKCFGCVVLVLCYRFCVVLWWWLCGCECRYKCG